MFPLIETRFQAGFNVTEYSRQPPATGSGTKADGGGGVSDAAADIGATVTTDLPLYDYYRRAPGDRYPTIWQTVSIAATPCSITQYARPATVSEPSSQGRWHPDRPQARTFIGQSRQDRGDAAGWRKR